MIDIIVRDQSSVYIDSVWMIGRATLPVLVQGQLCPWITVQPELLQ